MNGNIIRGFLLLFLSDSEQKYDFQAFHIAL